MKTLISLLLFITVFSSASLASDTSASASEPTAVVQGEVVNVEETAEKVTFQLVIQVLNTPQTLSLEQIDFFSNKAEEINFVTRENEILVHATFKKKSILKKKKGWLLLNLFRESELPPMRTEVVDPGFTPIEKPSFSWNLLLEYDSATQKTKMSLTPR